MKKTSLVLAAALSCIALSATAGGSRGSQGANGAAGGGGGGGGGGGAGFGVAAASTRTEIGIANTVGFGLTTGATTATGGLGFGGNSSALGGAGGSIGSGAVQVSAGNSTYRAASAPAFAPPASGPIRSCRLFVGLGGTTTSGSLSGGIPIGNDQACVVESSHEIMTRLNALKPGAFKYVDYLRPACKFEGLAETDECKALAQQQPAAAPVGIAYTPN